MPEGITAESLMNNIMETISDGVSKHKDVLFSEEKSGTATFNPKRLFGREKPVHHILGGGKSADVLLWRNKKSSASILTGATVIWVLFEWLNYHFLALLCFVLVIGMVVQFLWRNAYRSPSSVPRLVLPEEVFVNSGKLVASELNRGLVFLQNVACEGNIKQFLGVTACLFVASIIGNWCNFLTLIYVGFVAAHTLPALYEKYEDQVDGCVSKLLEQLQHSYRKLDARVPRAAFKGKKLK